jgi:hypothetical protein
MTLLSGIAPKKLFLVSLTIAAIGLSRAAVAQPEAMGHAESAGALKCLLDHDHKNCRYGFAGSATRVAMRWLWCTPDMAFELGDLQTWNYARTQPANAYTTKLLNGRTADVYDVKFRHHEKTFYIVPPGPDGKVRYMLIRDGSPDEERTDMFVRGPG